MACKKRRNALAHEGGVVVDNKRAKLVLAHGMESRLLPPLSILRFAVGTDSRSRRVVPIEPNSLPHCIQRRDLHHRSGIPHLQVKAPGVERAGELESVNRRDVRRTRMTASSAFRKTNRETSSLRRTKALSTNSKVDGFPRCSSVSHHNSGWL